MAHTLRQAAWLFFFVVPAVLMIDPETQIARSDDVNEEFSLVPKFSVKAGKLRTFEGIWDPPVCARKCNDIPTCNAFMLSPGQGKCVLVRNRLQEYSDAFKYYEKHLDEVEKGEDQGKARKRFMAEMAAHLDPNSNGFFDAELAARDAALKRLERDRKMAAKILADANKHALEAEEIATQMKADNAKAQARFFAKISSRRIRDQEEMTERGDPQSARISALDELQATNDVLSVSDKAWEHEDEIERFQTAVIQSSAAVVDDSYLEGRVGTRATSEGAKRVWAAQRRLEVAKKANQRVKSSSDKILKGVKMTLEETRRTGKEKISAMKQRHDMVIGVLQKKLNAADARVIEGKSTMKMLRQERVTRPAQAEADGQADMKEAEGRQDLAFAAVEAATDRSAISDQRVNANKSAAEISVAKLDNTTGMKALELKQNTSNVVTVVEFNTSVFRNSTANETAKKGILIDQLASDSAQSAVQRAGDTEKAADEGKQVGERAQDATAEAFKASLQLKESQAEVELRLRDVEFHQARAQNSLQLELNAGKAQRRATWFLRQHKDKLVANYTDLVDRQKRAEQKAEQMAEQTTEPNTTDEEKRRLLMGAGDAAIEGERLQVLADKLAAEIAQLDHVAAQKAVLAVRKVQQKSKQEQKETEQAMAAETNSASAAIAEVARMKDALKDLVQHGPPEEATLQQELQQDRYHVDLSPPAVLPENFSLLLASRLAPSVQSASRMMSEWGPEVGNVTALSRILGEPGTSYMATATGIFKIEGGKVLQVAGGGPNPGFTDGVAESARFHNITGISAQRTAVGDIIYVADKGNHAVRRIAAGLVTTVAGGKTVRCVECDDGRAALDTCCDGQGIASGMVDGAGEEALFRDPVDVALLVSGLTEDAYIVDQQNHALRHIHSYSGENSVVQTLAGNGSGFQDGLPEQSKLQAPGAVAAVRIDDTTHRIFVADTGNRAVRMLDIGFNADKIKQAAARQLLRSSWTNKLANAKKFKVNLPILHEEITAETKRLHGLKVSITQVRARQAAQKKRRQAAAALAALAAPPVLDEKVLKVQQFSLEHPPLDNQIDSAQNSKLVVEPIPTGPRFTTGAVGPAAADKRCQFPFVSKGMKSEADCSHDWSMLPQPVTPTSDGWCLVGPTMLFDPSTSEWGGCQPPGYVPTPVVCKLSNWSEWSTKCNCKRRAFLRTRSVISGKCKEHLEEEKKCICHLMTTIIAPVPHAEAHVVSRKDWSATQISAVESEQAGKHVLFIGADRGGAAVRAVVGGRPSNFTVHVDTINMAAHTQILTAASPWAMLVQSPQMPASVTSPPTGMRCEYSTGDGQGGSKLSLGSALSAANCAALVHAQEPTANGASFSASGDTECVARFGMTSILAATSGWESCYILDSTDASDQPDRETLSQVNLWMTLQCDDEILSELRNAWPSEAAQNTTVNAVQRAVPLNLQLNSSMFEMVAVRRLRKVQIYGPPNWAATLSKYVLCSKHKNEMLQEAVEQRCCEIRNMDWTQTISNSAWRPTKENLAHVIESEF